MMKKMYFYQSCLLLLSLLVAVGCTNKQGNKQSSEQPTITVTLEPQRFFTEAIAGNKFNVISMVPKGTSPETYDPVPQQLVALGNSKAYFRIGYIGFEQTWMARLIDNTPHLQLFDTSKGVDLIVSKCGHDHTQEGGDNANEGHSHPVEPHIWNSTANAMVIAANTFKALCTLDKANEPYYWARYDSLCQRIKQADNTIRQILETPETSRSFIIYHPALSYFARDYGLHQISIEEDGKEPSPAHLKELIDLCKAEKVRVIFIQPEFDKRNAEIIAGQTGAKIVPINPLSYNWEEEMINIAKALAGKDTTISTN